MDIDEILKLAEPDANAFQRQCYGSTCYSITLLTLFAPSAHNLVCSRRQLEYYCKALNDREEMVVHP